MSAYLQAIRDSNYFRYFIVGVIVVATITIGIETYPSMVERYGSTLKFIDTVILVIFCLEILIKIGAEGARPWRFFYKGWNVFDFVIVALCLYPTHDAAILRLARVLRTLRLLSSVPRLQMIVTALIRSLPSMFYVTVLLMLFFYVYSVLGVFLFRENDPQHFGNLGQAMLSLFRMVTLEDWTDIMYTAIYGSDVYPAEGPVPVGPVPNAFGIWGVLYFITFVVFGSLIIINLFIGIVVTSLSQSQAEQLVSRIGPKSASPEEPPAASANGVELEPKKT